MARERVGAELAISMVANSQAPGRRPRIEVRLSDGTSIRVDLTAQEFTDALSGLYLTGLTAEVIQ